MDNAIAAFSAAVMLATFFWGTYADKKKSGIIKRETESRNRATLAQETKNAIERERLQFQIDSINSK